MSVSIKILHRKIETILRGAGFFLVILLALFILIYIAIKYFDLKESAELWDKLFETRINRIIKLIGTDKQLPYVNYLIIDKKGVITGSSDKILNNLTLNNSGLFSRIYDLGEGEVRVLFYPDMADGVQRVHLAKWQSGFYSVYSFESDDIFPDFIARKMNLILEIGGVIWYSNNQDLIGDRYNRSFIQIYSGEIFFSISSRITGLKNTNVAILHNITSDVNTFLVLIIIFIVLIVVINRMIRNIQNDFILLKNEQELLVDYIISLSEAFTKENNITAGFPARPLSGWNELQFEENNQIHNLMQKFVNTIRDAEDRMLHALQEKESLIQELYHRTRNTMQIICGMMKINALKLPSNTELQQLVNNTDEKIQAISLVHQMLYEYKDLSRISISNYIAQLVCSLFARYNITKNRIKLETDIDDDMFLLDVAIPLGLILNELITNSIKHAFPDSRDGKILIRLKKNLENLYLLDYSDNGKGFPDGFNFNEPVSSGFYLIIGLAQNQMGGKVEMKDEGGFHFNFQFKKNTYKERV